MEPPPPRVVLFPLSAQGHVNAMLKLAELLAAAGLHVTFLNTEYAHGRLLRHAGIQSRLSLYPGFLFRAISDGLSDARRRSSDRGIMEVVRAMQETTKPLLKRMLAAGDLGPSVSCVIADGIFSGLVCDVGDELGIPVILFRTVSACCFWSYLFIPHLIQTGQLPCRGKEDLDRPITGIPGMESFLRLRDLPGFCRTSDTNDQFLNLVYRETKQSIRARGIILNTFEDLEGPVLSHIRANWPNVYALGPLHQHLNTRLSENNRDLLPLSRSTNSLFEVDESCMTWLDSQPAKSVIYVSFGSIAVMSKGDLVEFWHGLINSHARFLWVVRKDLLVDIDDGQVLDELHVASEERGFVAEWVPQEEVLSHEAVGAFLTHSGWNSTLESLVAGVPMICWPYFADQQINSRFVGEIWRLGIDMKDICDRRVVEKMVTDVMLEMRDKFERSTAEMARLAFKTVTPGGSSYRDLDRLIEDIRSMTNK